MSAEVGFDALYFGRINYDDREARAAEKRLEFVWQASPSQPGSTVFTGVFSDGNYQPPPGICFDLRCDNDPVMDDGRLTDFNLDSLTDTLIQGRTCATCIYVLRVFYARLFVFASPVSNQNSIPNPQPKHETRNLKPIVPYDTKVLTTRRPRPWATM